MIPFFPLQAFVLFLRIRGNELWPELLSTAGHEVIFRNQKTELKTGNNSQNSKEARRKRASRLMSDRLAGEGGDMGQRDRWRRVLRPGFKGGKSEEMGTR